jgi:flagellar biosynthesis chaperone FliJ
MSDAGPIGNTDSGIGSEGSSGESSSPVSPSTSTDGGGDQGGVNPAWEPFLSELPEYFRPKATPHLKKWDENYRNLETQHRELSEKYKPYEPYLGVDPANLGNAWNIYETINNDPKRVYEALTEHMKALGMLPNDTQQQQGNDGEPPENAFGQVDPKLTELERRQAELDSRQASMDEYVQQQVYERQVQTYEKDIDQQVQGLVNKYGAAVDVEDVLQRMFNQASAGKQLDAEAAFNDQKSTFQRLYKAQNGGRLSPQIIPPTGTPAASGEKKPEDMNEEETKAYFKHLLDIANAGG